MSKLCNEMKGRDPDPEILQNIEEKEQEIKNFISKGNLIRAKNDVLNKIYKEGKEVNRKEEMIAYRFTLMICLWSGPLGFSLFQCLSSC